MGLTEFTKTFTMVNMRTLLTTPPARRDQILDAVIPVFGRYGFKKTSMEDLAEAAQLSKQGLYLHFSGKEEVFQAAMQKYLGDGLIAVERSLNRSQAPLGERLLGAMEAWFGRHLATFTPASFDVIEAGDKLSGAAVDGCKAAFQALISKAIAESAEFQPSRNACTPQEIAQVLFLCGLTWKEAHAVKAEFLQKMGLCIRACCRLGQKGPGRTGGNRQARRIHP